MVQGSYNVPAALLQCLSAPQPGSCDHTDQSLPAAAPRPRPHRVMWLLLEYLEGDGRVLDGHDDAAVVQVQDVMLLLENLQTGSGL